MGRQLFGKSEPGAQGAYHHCPKESGAHQHNQPSRVKIGILPSLSQGGQAAEQGVDAAAEI